MTESVSGFRGSSKKDISVYYATVTSAAAIVDQSGGVTATKLSAGRYEIDLHRGGNANAVFVRTQTSDGVTNEDHGFHLVVVC